MLPPINRRLPDWFVGAFEMRKYPWIFAWGTVGLHPEAQRRRTPESEVAQADSLVPWFKFQCLTDNAFTKLLT